MTGRQETPEAARPQGPAGGWLRIAAALALNVTDNVTAVTLEVQ